MDWPLPQNEQKVTEETEMVCQVGTCEVSNYGAKSENAVIAENAGNESIINGAA
jgi:hypothetical protein